MLLILPGPMCMSKGSDLSLTGSMGRWGTWLSRPRVCRILLVFVALSIKSTTRPKMGSPCVFPEGSEQRINSLCLALALIQRER